MNMPLLLDLDMKFIINIYFFSLYGFKFLLLSFLVIPTTCFASIYTCSII